MGVYIETSVESKVLGFHSFHLIHSTGQQRSKMLATLYKDERCQTLPAFNILEKM